MRKLSTADNFDTEGLTMQIVRAIALLMMGLAACGQAGNDPPSSATCVIDGTTFQDGEAAPNAPCLRCRVATSPTSWTAEPAETACDDGSGCTSDDKCSPAGECRGSAAALGTACDAGVCDSEGACQRACLIDNTLIPADGAKPSDRCLVCEPSTSTSSWTRVTGACAQCGNSTVDTSEECDDGNSINTDGCTNSCKRPACGDRIVSRGEECDDGNSVDNDGCTNACNLPRCGDGIVHSNEACDDGNTVGSDGCVSCKFARCGDGSVQAGVEECDDANTVNDDACTNACTIVRCPTGMIYIRPTPGGPGASLSPYCIDRTEVAFSQLPSTRSMCNNSSVHGLTSQNQNHPAICIRLEGATTYCNSIGKRLPTDAEWVYAAQGDDGRAYPWGNGAPSCGLATYMHGSTNVIGSFCSPNAVTPVGSLLAGASPFGVLDMSGNVAEWVSNGRLRGGSWRSNQADIMISRSRPPDPTLAVHDGAVTDGVRCARNPLR